MNKAQKFYFKLGAFVCWLLDAHDPYLAFRMSDSTWHQQLMCLRCGKDINDEVSIGN